MVEWNWNAPTAATPFGSRSSRTNDGHRAIPTPACPGRHTGQPPDRPNRAGVFCLCLGLMLRAINDPNQDQILYEGRTVVARDAATHPRHPATTRPAPVATPANRPTVETGLAIFWAPRVLLSTPLPIPISKTPRVGAGHYHAGTVVSRTGRLR